jgi:PAS domain S-box-containing protein
MGEKAFSHTWDQLPQGPKYMRQQISTSEITENKHKLPGVLTKASGTEFSQLLDAAACGICLVDTDLNLLQINETFSRLSGVSKDEAAGRKCYEVIPNTLCQSSGCSLTRISRGETYVEHDVEIDNKYGLPIPCTVAAIPMQTGNNELSGIIETFTNITEREKIQQALQESEAKFHNILSSSLDVLYRLNLNTGTLDYISPSVMDLCGYSPEEIMSLSLQELISLVHPEDVETQERHFNQMATNHKEINTVTTTEFRFKHKDLGYRWISNTCTMLFDNGNEPKALAGSLRDATEKKRAEETLKQSWERYRNILDNIQDGYFEVDNAGNFTYFNDSMCRILGYSRTEMNGMNNRACMDDMNDRLIKQSFDHVCRTGEPIENLSVECTGKDGGRLVIEISISPLRGTTGDVLGFRGIARDITERIRAEEQRRELEQRAQVASRLASVGEMASGIAHEINNPLTAIVGYAQVLMEKDIPYDSRKMVEIINEASQEVSAIVKRVLTFARQQKPELDCVSINDSITTTINLRAHEMKMHNIEVTAQLDPDLPPTIADGGQLQQVFLNLIINAEKEMKSAHGRGNLLIKTESVNNTIRISITDNGPGIDGENLEKIFDPFFTTRKTGEGTGLGLSVCHGIITEHNGRIYAKSTPGQGATFVVELPVITGNGQIKPEEPAVEEFPRVNAARILVVDDEQLVLQLLDEVLTGDGHKVETVDNAEDALKMIEDEEYSLILLDIKMPDISGFELYNRIRHISQSKAERIVFITGDIAGEDTREFLTSSNAPFTTKPINTTRLKQEINRALA